MKKVETDPWSPNLAFYAKSPVMLNGRLEMFADSSEFILKWGGEEESLEREGDKGGRGIRRRSQKIVDLCQKFEPDEYGQKVDLEVDVEGGMVGDQCSNVRKSTERGLKISNIAHIFENSGQVLPKNDSVANTKFELAKTSSED